jgi:hypothetical protein
MTPPAIPSESSILAAASSPTVAQLRHENRELRERLAKLAALVDHYYCGYRESQGMLERRERELSEMRRRLDSKPIGVRGERR